MKNRFVFLVVAIALLMIVAGFKKTESIVCSNGLNLFWGYGFSYYQQERGYTFSFYGVERFKTYYELVFEYNSSL